MSPLSILDQLQSLDSDSKSTFADSTSSFNKAQGDVKTKLGVASTGFNLDISDLSKNFDTAAKELSNGGGKNAIPAAPFSVNELKIQVTGKLDGLTNINLETLQQAIPSTPGADTFKNLNITTEVNETIASLTSAITGNANFGKLNLPQSDAGPFAEFQQFLTKAGALPVRVLEAILTVFKRFVDKLNNPDEWLGSLSSEALTEIFVTQIRDLTEELPHTAISVISTGIDQRCQVIKQYQDLLKSIDPTTLNREKIAGFRQQVKDMTRQVEVSSQKMDTALTNLKTFDINQFSQILLAFPGTGADGDTAKIETLSTIFDGLENFVKGLDQRIGTVTDQLKAFTQKIQELIQQAIEKVGSVAKKITDTIREKIEAAGRTLDQVAAYLKDAIAKLTDFVQKACNQSDQMVKPLKNACNQFASTTVNKIEDLSKTIKQQTESLRKSILDVNQTIEKQLNREELENKIRELLSKVTNVLQGQEVRAALDSADKGIQQIVEALQKVSLDPAFKLAVQKTTTLENKLKAIDVSKLGTAQKAALKVGVTVIKQVDVPGTVKPELTSAFDEVFEPLVNLVNSIQGECNKIDTKVKEFAPGTLAANALKPYIDKLIDELNQYRPSVVLTKVQEIYQTLLTKLDVLNPDQLLQVLDDLYQKLVDVVQALSPKSLTEFLDITLGAVTHTLKNLPIEQLVEKVIDSIGDVEKLLGGLGLDSILNSGFWRSLEEILSPNLLKDTIKKVDAIKTQAMSRVNTVDEVALQTELGNLRQAIAQYADNPTQTVNDAAGNIDTAIEAYRTLWQQQPSLPSNFTPPIDWEFDYQDLLKRLQDLNQQLAVNLLEDVVTQAKKIIADGKTRLQPTTKPTLNLAKNDADIIAAFKQAIPDELESQLTGPIKRILGSLDQTLARPRGVIDEVKKVIQRLASAPQELANILKQVAEILGTTIRGAIEKVNVTIENFTANLFGTINDLYVKITDKIKELMPSQILNSFYDVSDFAGSNPDKLLLRLRSPSPDAVSQYFLNQLEESQRVLVLSVDGEGTHRALRQGLNKLLKDSKFYSVDRFKGVKLPKEAEALTAKANQLKSQEVIRLNRLLLEAVYTEAITKSLQSIFPYFKEKLAEIYPTELVKTLDDIHAKIINDIKGFPDVLKTTLNGEYQKVEIAYQAIRDRINKIFQALLARLRALQSELGIGIEDISDAYNRLLNALPV